MQFSNAEWQTILEQLSQFETKVEMTTLMCDLKGLNDESVAQDLKICIDRLQGLMHAEGAGSILVNDCSLPQVAHKAWLYLNQLQVKA